MANSVSAATAAQSQDDLNDAIFATFQTRFTAVCGGTINGGMINWQTIIAMIEQLLSGCVTPTAASLRKQMKRPLIRIKATVILMSKYNLVYADASKSVSALDVMIEGGQDANNNTVPAATDAELTSFITACAA